MGSKTPAQTTQTTKQELSPEQQQLMQLAMPYAQQYASQPIQQFQGTGIAPLTALEQQASGKMLDAGATGGELAGKAATAQGMLLDPAFMLDVANNPYLRSQAEALAGGLTQNLTENQLPAIRSGSTVAGGQYSGGATRQGMAEGKAIAGTNTAIGNSVADLMFNAYHRGLTGMQQAVSANPGVQSQQLFDPAVMSAVGGQDRALQQAQLDEQIRQFYTGQALPFLQAQELMSLLSGMPGGQTTSKAVGTTPGVNPVMGGLGGAASGAYLGSMLMPGVGTGIGAGIGAGAGGLLGLLMNR